jgi:hypothetical protein
MKDKSVEELRDIVRRAENSHISESQYQRAKEELSIRNHENVITSLNQKNLWYQKPFGLIFIGVVISIIAGIILSLMSNV